MSGEDREMGRREVLAGMCAAVAGLSGCLGDSGDNKPPENSEKDPLDTNFQYHFRDAEGFNQVGGEAPENADEHQVVESFVQTSDKVDTWAEMLTNDHNKDRLTIDDSIEPLVGELDGSVEEIVQKTGELFNNWPENEKEFEEDYSSDIAGIEVTQIEEIEDKAEEFTMALRGASAIVTGHNNSAAANYLNTNLAEYTLEQLDVDIPGYKLSTLWTAIDTIYEEQEEKAGFDHPIGFLQYEDEDGNQKAKHFELENSVWDRHSARMDKSVYTTPLNQEVVDTGGYMEDYETNNFLSALDYERGRKVEERGELLETFDKAMLGALRQMVDDAPEFYHYDESVQSGAESEAGLKPAISDSFGRSVSDYARNPTKEKKRYLEGTSRAIFSAMDKQGWDEPIALDGTIENPEVYYATKETTEDIHQDRAYDEVRQRVTAG